MQQLRPTGHHTTLQDTYILKYGTIYEYICGLKFQLSKGLFRVPKPVIADKNWADSAKPSIMPCAQKVYKPPGVASHLHSPFIAAVDLEVMAICGVQTQQTTTTRTKPAAAAAPALMPTEYAMTSGGSV